MRLCSATLVSMFVACCLVAQAQIPTIINLINPGTGGAGPIAPGQQVNISGSNLGDTTSVNCGAPVPTVCGGVSVLLNGIPVPVRSEAAQQVIFYAPMTLALGGATVQVSRQTGGQALQSAVFNATVAAAAPGLFSTNVNGVTLANMLDTTGAVFTPATPAHAGDTVKALGTGFGVTNPIFTPGTAVPVSPAYNVVAAVKVTVGGQPATVISSTLVPGGIGATDQVIFQVPAGLSGGNQPVVVNVGGVNSQTLQLPLAFTGPNVTSVVNSASNAVAGLPNGGVAPGSILVAYGSLLGPATLVVAPGYPWTETLSGTSAQITVGGVTTKLLLYYTSATQIAGLLPSSTPAGTGTITVTYNGVTGGPSPITVQASNFGVYTVGQNGAGAGIVTFADYSLVPQTKAANPGETLIIWGTGLGAVAGNEAAGPLPGDLTTLPVQVFVGGLPATVVYRGRSGCCVGEDQIAFVVPTNVTGCNVPLAVQVKNSISNYSLMSVVSTGRACVPAFSVFPDSSSTIPQPKLLFAQIARQVLPTPQFPGDQPSSDDIQVSPVKLGISGAQLNVLQDVLSFGSCLVTVGNNSSGSSDPPIVGGMDAGASLTLKGPAGTTRALPKSGFQYTAHLGDTTAGNFLDVGAYTLTGAGGADIGSFIGAFNIPAFTWTNKPAGNGTLNVTRSQGLTLTWTGGDPKGYVEIQGGSGGNGVGAGFACIVRGGDGTFTVPPAVLLALPAGGGRVSVQDNPAPQLFSAPGVDVAAVSLELTLASQAQFQ